MASATIDFPDFTDGEASNLFGFNVKNWTRITAFHLAADCLNVWTVNQFSVQNKENIEVNCGQNNIHSITFLGKVEKCISCDLNSGVYNFEQAIMVDDYFASPAATANCSLTLSI